MSSVMRRWWVIVPGILALAPALQGAARPVARRPVAPRTDGPRVTARAFTAPATGTPASGDLVTLVAAQGEHELAEISIETSGRSMPTLAITGDAKAGTATIARTEFGLAPQLEVYDRPGLARYWLGVQVPLSAKPGTYRLPLRVMGGPTPRAVTVAVKVLPIVLTGASKMFVVHFGPPPTPEERPAATGTDPANAVPDPADQELRGRLSRLRSRGVTVVGFDRPPAEMAAALEIARAVRFRGPAPCSLEPGQDVPQRVAAAAMACRERSLPALLWVTNGDQPLDPEARAAVRATGGSVAVRMEKLSLPDAAGGAGAVLYSLGAPQAVTLLSARAPQTSTRPEWLTWDPATETPLRNRLYAGFLLWKAGLGGAYWRAEDSVRFWSPRSPDFRHLESLSEGIEDARYLTVLAALIRQIRDMDRRHPLPNKADAALRAALERLSPSATESQVAAARQTVIAQILACQAVVH